MKGDIKMTGRVLSTGQPRPYADSMLRAVVIAERHCWVKNELDPMAITEEQARAAAAGLLIGYTPVTREEAPMMGSYLSYFRPLGETDEEGRSPVWEFGVCTPFTD